MERSKLADLSEIFSSIAIVVTLVYLTVEIDQNTDAIHAQTREAVLTGAQTELAAVRDNPNLIKSMIKTQHLNTDEQIQLFAWITSIMRTREFAWLQRQNGIIDDSQWATELAVLSGILESTRTRLWWEKIGRKAVSEEFGVFVDDLLKDLPTSDGFFETQTNWASEPSAKIATPPNDK